MTTNRTNIVVPYTLETSSLQKSMSFCCELSHHSNTNYEPVYEVLEGDKTIYWMFWSTSSSGSFNISLSLSSNNKKISNQCDMHRQTFYYHFQDRYELLDWMLYNELISSFVENFSYETMEEKFYCIFNTMYNDKKFYQNYRIFCQNLMD